ncbi:alpha/beta hydrolase [Glutamicibacter sp. PS]|uniref:alpha/beta fold hydrolase n=1 Tax=Glutamicibacter sp. PS TaxID=3075634 RepID=UPI002848A03D|nr:alpha/beta hydrolase [Glutamicibacter sp. PS]MDR4533885.1 alpha/beta hydrolase [Glutamicibacter sp. PS]
MSGDKRNEALDPNGYAQVHPASSGSAASGSEQTLVLLHGGSVGNWVWEPQVRAFARATVLTPHLPSFGARSDEDWAGLQSAADDVAALIAEEVPSGGVHLVGMSVGGLIAAHVAARHPELVQSLLLSGTPASGVPALARNLNRWQLKLAGSPWYWRFQAGAYGMVDDEKELFARHGVTLQEHNLRAITEELAAGGLPEDLNNYTGPALALAGALEPKLVASSFPALQAKLPQVATRLVPGVHHQWNIETPLLFNAVLRQWAFEGRIHSKLTEAPARAGKSSSLGAKFGKRSATDPAPGTETQKPED